MTPFSGPVKRQASEQGGVSEGGDFREEGAGLGDATPLAQPRLANGGKTRPKPFEGLFGERMLGLSKGPQVDGEVEGRGTEPSMPVSGRGLRVF